jgi:preprotein translocase SecE subunit
MAFGIYKPGQGYWLRVLTAVGVGVVTLYAAVWGWGQAEAVRLPAKEWTIAAQAVTGQVGVGDTVVLIRYEGTSTAPLGTARVAEFREGSARRATLVIDSFDSTTTRDTIPDAFRVIAGESLAPTFRADIASSAPTPVIPQLYLQAIVAGSLILVGTLAIAWFVAFSPRAGDFLIATDSEMKKVNWTTYKHVRGSTIVVIVAAFLIAGILFIVDLGFSSFFKAVGVLEG